VFILQFPEDAVKFRPVATRGVQKSNAEQSMGGGTDDQSLVLGIIIH